MRFEPSIRSGALRRGFTVLELMVSVAIMTVIVIALYSVFDATQKALRSTISQVDALEGIRATTDLMVRDMEAAAPVQLANTNLTSFAAYLNPLAESVPLKGLRKDAPPVLNTLLQDIYCVGRQNDTWTSIGYWVGPINTNQLGQRLSFGRLYRYSYETNGAAFAFTNLYARFNGPLRVRDSQMVMDGVVHLRVYAYDRFGNRLVVNPSAEVPPEDDGVVQGRLNNLYTIPFANSPLFRAWYPDPVQVVRTAYRFTRNSLPVFPAALELEIGVLEPQVAIRAASIPDAAVARDYLARQAGSVHFFRYRVPLRNAPTF